MKKQPILVCAGGTGGHLFPAAALAEELGSRGWDVQLVSDQRAERYSHDFPASAMHRVDSATFGGRNPIKIIKAMIKLFSGTRQSRHLLGEINPAAVVGFGGYPTIPPLWAAAGLGIPTILHEQNAVMGRANRLLAGKANAIGLGFEGKLKIENATLVGNPVRPPVLEAAKQAYHSRKAGDPFQLLIFGGSQGAQYFSKVIVAALTLLDEADRSRIQLVQQARPEDERELVAALTKLKVAHEVSQFFNPMAGRIADAHLVICRAGASTVSELAVIGRPSILVPYPFALDHDQAMNAAALEAAVGCEVIKQSDLSAQHLAQRLSEALAQPDELAIVAQKAKATGRPNAAYEFADLVEQVISKS